MPDASRAERGTGRGGRAAQVDAQDIVDDRVAPGLDDDPRATAVDDVQTLDRAARSAGCAVLAGLQHQATADDLDERRPVVRWLWLVASIVTGTVIGSDVEPRSIT